MSYADLHPNSASRTDPKIGPTVSPIPWKAINNPEMLLCSSVSSMFGYRSSIDSIISGITGIIIIPQPNPIIAKPNTIKAGELYKPNNLEGPTNISAITSIKYPRQMTPDFFILDVNT